MQRDFVIQQLKEEAKNVEQHVAQLLQNESLTQAEAEQFLNDLEKLYRNLAVYAHVLKTQGNLQVHLKIMQSVPPVAEEPVTPVAKEEMKTEKQEIKDETIEEYVAPSVVADEAPSLKKIEFSINDKFRIINELFFQNPKEFETVIQQLNAITSVDEMKFYLDSLKQIYNWKDDNQLVKTLYSLANKRFS